MLDDLRIPRNFIAIPLSNVTHGVPAGWVSTLVSWRR
jgi:hypothetical protein